MKSRLISLDVLRGLTVATMILVNNGAGREHFHQLTHSVWNGITLCDLVFPFFLFMVGLSISFSKPDRRKIIVRTIKMFSIGVLLHAWDMWVYGEEDILSNLRIWGVLERIALCYCVVSFIVKVINPRYYWYIIVAILLSYCGILYYGNGYAQDDTNIAVIIDRYLLSPSHLYHKSPIDPEGLLGTLPAIAHTLIGAVIGGLIRQKKGLEIRLITIFTIAAVMLVAGVFMSSLFPLNKRIWSPSYVLVTCGLASMLLTIFTFIIDFMRWQKWTVPFRWFGMNAIVLYVASEMLAPIMGRSGISNFIYTSLLDLGFIPQLASLSYALSFVLLMTLLAWFMNWRKWYIKL